VVSFARPEDWIPGLSVFPLAKIAGTVALLAFLFAFREIRWPLPREAVYLILLGGQLFLTVPLSPVWPGGAFLKTLDFAKVVIIVVVIVSVVNTLKLLRRLIFIQVASILAVAGVSIWNGHMHYKRLEGVLGGDYADPNSLALVIVTSLPLCLALLFLGQGILRKVIWALAMLLMVYGVFLTGSRGGFISLIAATAVCLWELSIQGRRRYLLLVAALVGVISWHFASGTLAGRLQSTFSQSQDNESAYTSAEQRRQLLWRSIEVTLEHPIFGVGPGNFETISGSWHATHNSFTQMSSEGGLPAFILYVLILWRGFKNVQVIKRLARGKKSLRLMGQALHASLTGYVVGAFFISTSYELFPYFLVAYTTALAWIVKNSISCPEKVASVIPAPEEDRAYAMG
jgi:O-antigen ligase